MSRRALLKSALAVCLHDGDILTVGIVGRPDMELCAKCREWIHRPTSNPLVAEIKRLRALDKS